MPPPRATMRGRDREGRSRRLDANGARELDRGGARRDATRGVGLVETVASRRGSRCSRAHATFEAMRETRARERETDDSRDFVAAS